MSQKSDERRLKIILEAISLVHEQGLTGLTAREIAKRLKIQPSAVFYYYPSHTDLFHGAQAYAMEAAEGVVQQYMVKAQAETPVAMLQAYVFGTVFWAYHNPSHVLLLTSGFVHSGISGFSHQHQLTTARGIEKIYHWLAVSVAEGLLAPHPKLRSFAELIHASLTGACMKVVLDPPKDERDLQDFTQMLWDMMCHGMTRND